MNNIGLILLLSCKHSLISELSFSDSDLELWLSVNSASHDDK